MGVANDGRKGGVANDGRKGGVANDGRKGDVIDQPIDGDAMERVIDQVEGLATIVVPDQAMGIDLINMHKFPNPKTPHIVLIAYEYNVLGFSLVGQEVESNGEESQEGPQVGDLSYAPISLDMIRDTQLVECLDGNESGFNAKSLDCPLVVAKKARR
jgi:hypothetical protein